MPVADQGLDAHVGDVIAGGPGFVAVGSDYSRGYVWASADGITWEALPSARQWRRVSIDRLVDWNGMLVAAGRDGGHAAFWTSRDGLDWQRLPDRPEFDFYVGRRGGYYGGFIQRLYVDGSDLVAEGTMVYDIGSSGSQGPNASALRQPVSRFAQPWVTWRTADGITWTRQQEMIEIPAPPPPTIAILGERWVRVGEHLGLPAAFVSPPVAAPPPPGGVLRIAWTGTTGAAIYSSPAFADGVVFVSSSDGFLYAFAAGCGNNGAACSPVWSGLGSYGFGPPAVADGFVHVISGEGRLHTFEVGCGSGGAVCVPASIGTSIGNGNSSPAVADGAVYVAGWSDSYVGLLVYAFDSGCIQGGGTCAPLWTGAIRDLDYQLGNSPVVASGVVYVTSDDGRLNAFEVGCGSGGAVCSPMWTAATTGYYLASPPVVADGVVYVGSQAGDSIHGELYAFAVGCGSGGAACAPLWTAVTGGVISSAPAVAGGEVYVSSRDGKLYAFAVGCASGGAACGPLWTGDVGHGFPVTAAPAVADGVVYVGSQDGTLYGFAVGCGSGGAVCEPLRTGTVGGAINSAPMVADGMVYVGAGDGKLYAFALEP